MKHKSELIAAACVAALALVPLSLSAAEKKKAASPAPAGSASPAASPAKASTRPLPFHGMVSEVDQKAKTFTIAGKTSTRVFKITDRTEIMKGGTAGTMTDIVANEEVRGSYWKTADGSLEAKKVTVGKADSGEKKSKKAKESKASPSPTP